MPTVVDEADEQAQMGSDDKDAWEGFDGEVVNVKLTNGVASVGESKNK